MLAYHVLAALAAPLLLQGAPAPALKWEPSLLIQLQVADLDRSVRFYAETLGFKIAERRDDLGFAHVDCGISGLQLGLSAVGSRPTAPGSVVLNFGVTGDIEAARKVLESRGVVFLGPTVVIAGKVRLAEFKDPDGHRLRLAIDDKLNSAMSSFETAAAKGRVRPERKARVQGIPGGMMLVRDVVGDYSQHPKVFAEMMRVDQHEWST